MLGLHVQSKGDLVFDTLNMNAYTKRQYPYESE